MNWPVASCGCDNGNTNRLKVYWNRFKLPIQRPSRTFIFFLRKREWNFDQGKKKDQSITILDLLNIIVHVKWDAFSWWTSSLCCSMWKSDEMTIGKMHPTLYINSYPWDEFHFRWLRKYIIEIGMTQRLNRFLCDVQKVQDFFSQPLGSVFII